MVKVRVLVRVVSFLRSRERAFLSDDVVVPFRLKTMKREQQKTPNDARQKRSRGDATGKSRPRGHAKTASAFIDDIFSSDDETIKARSAQNAFLGNVFTAPLLGRDSRWWRFGTARFKARADLYLYLSLSLSRNNRFKNTQQHRLGKPKSRSRRRRKSRNTRATSSACGPSSPACSARCCPSRCKCAGINTGLYRKNLSANLNTATRRMSRTRRIRAGCIHGLRRIAR